MRTRSKHHLDYLALALCALLWPALALSEQPSAASKPLAVAAPTLHLEASADDQWLTLKYALRNTDRTILVHDRLYVQAGKRQVPDPEQLQRFVHGKTLRLLHGWSPAPARGAAYVVVPHASKLAPRASSSRTLRVPLPTREYNSGRSEPSRFTETKIDDVVLLVEYSDAQGVKLKRSSVFPGAFELVDLPSKAPQIAQSNSVPLALTVRRVDDPAFPRLSVAGDAQGAQSVR